MSGDSRVSIPNNVRKMIQEIKKRAGRHNVEFIYTMLKECNMDPNEAGQRLKMIQKMREIAGKHSDEDIYTMLKDCNMDPNEAAQRLLYIGQPRRTKAPRFVRVGKGNTFHEVKTKRDRRKLNTRNEASEEYRKTRGNQWRGARGGRCNYYSSNVSDDVGGVRSMSLQKDHGETNHTERVSRSTMPVLYKTANNVALHGANSSTIAANGDLGLVPHVSAGATLPAGSRSSTGQDVADAVVAAETVDSDNRKMQRKSNVVEKSQLSESSHVPSLSNHNGSLAVNYNQDSLHPQQLNGPSKVVASEPSAVAVTNFQSVPEKKSVFEESTPKHDTMLEKLTLSNRQPVIFPDNLQVPETFRSGLTFGSLDVTPNDNGSISVAEVIQGNGEAVIESSLSSQNTTPIAPEGEFPDHTLPPPHVSENVLPSVDNISSDPGLKHEHPKHEIITPLGGFQNPLLQITRDYNFSLMPHVLGPHFVQLEVPKLQSGNSLVSSTSGSTPSTTQPAGIGQSSIALSPPVFPYFRQPYAPNYIPYNPYFPQFYLPQSGHHLFGHGVFPQQPPTGNVYVPSAAAAPGVQFPVPTPYKQGTTAGSLTHLGFPSGYGSYASSSVGYSAVVSPGSSSGSEDLTASQTKEKNFYTAVQQGEDSQVWAPAPGQNIPSLQPNYFYNLPQGPHMAFSPAQTGVYHPSQTMVAQSTVQPLMHQSQSMDGAVESTVAPASSYQQPQHAAQINWNTIS